MSTIDTSLESVAGDAASFLGTATAPDGKHVYVTTGRSKLVLFVDTATDTVTGSVEVGTRPWGMAVSPDGEALYTANGPSNDVSIVDVGTKQGAKKIPVGKGPWRVIFVEQPASSR